ncbi:MAG: glycerol-3-phosphate dehydrogenase/oxidase [Oceanospirillaceae bacterium]|nr:glycerol-3-phosphate dehydrogenase/oxidase [Oceanospirillaceae bacterium]
MTDEYDLIIIGGGINGAAICRDASMRGLKTLLLEMNDFAAGASGHNGRMIHGGLRYLENGDFPMVIEALQERNTLLKIAPHLVKPSTLLIPIFESSRNPAWKVKLGLMALDILAPAGFPRHKKLNKKAAMARIPTFRSQELAGGFLMYDAFAEFAERLTIENVLSAKEYGAELHNYACVTKIVPEPGVGFRVTWQEKNGKKSATARSVVNATGAWTDKVIKNAMGQQSSLTTIALGSFIVVKANENTPNEAVFLESRQDGRPIIVTPWQDNILIGTTDRVVSGDVDEAATSEVEIAYLMDALSNTFKAGTFKRSDIIFTYMGVRPLPFAVGPSRKITRKHVIHHHGLSYAGMISVYGGKLSTFRRLAEDAVNAVFKLRGKRAPKSLTAETPLPGAGQVEQIQFNEGFCLTSATTSRLAKIYGSKSALIIEMAQDTPDLATVIDTDSGAIAAEMVYAVRHEFARSLIDILLRRLMLGHRANRGREVLPHFRNIALRHLGWCDDKIDTDLVEFNNYLNATTGARFWNSNESNPPEREVKK